MPVFAPLGFACSTLLGLGVLFAIWRRARTESLRDADRLAAGHGKHRTSNYSPSVILPALDMVTPIALPAAGSRSSACWCSS